MAGQMFTDSRPRVRTGLAALLLLLAVGPLAAQQDLDIEKSTNGQDADVAPGPILTVGAAVTWTYVVSNTGSRDLVGVSVVDDQLGAISCPSSSLGAGLSMTCTANGTAAAGQYANLGTATGTIVGLGTMVSDSDPSHYFGQAAPAIAIEKSTEGQDADLPPGPVLAVGQPVNWTYVVTNVGSDPLDNVTVTDDQGVVVSCPATTLAVGASMTCTGAGTAQAGQYANVGQASATTVPAGEPTVASDPSHYFGQILLLEKATEGADADLPPGPPLVPGSPVTWTYVVSNPGPASVTGVAVTDDQGVIVSCPGTALAAGESVTCTGSGVVQAGQYANVGTATATLPLGGTVSVSDPSHYFGVLLALEKATNGFDADSPPGPSLAVGTPVSWTYVVTNASTDTLTAVDVTDDQGVTVSCPGTTLGAGASMTCTASGVAQAGQYANIGTAIATHPTEGDLAASDLSHYFGQTAILDFGDALDPTYPTLFASNGARHVLGSGVFLGACVDSEVEGAAAAGADGDDLATGVSTFGTCAVAGDDEDGVTFPLPLFRGQNGQVDVVANAACTLSAWIDFDADGDWFDAGENLFPGGQALAPGSSSPTFPIPAAAALGATRARFRCTTDGAVAFAGEAADGEVEDHVVTLEAGPPVVGASKTAALLVDLDGDGAADPGDTLLYTVTLTNTGLGDATAVVFADAPDPATALVVGSVVPSQGTVLVGNTAGDTTVQVDVGPLAASGGSATIAFQALIDDPPPAGVFSVANQGQVSGGNFAPFLTDDPATGAAADPTVVILGTPSVLEIPTLDGRILLALALLLAAAGYRLVR